MSVIAPPIGPGEWLNTSPVGPAHLAGRVSILVFFSVSNEASWLRLRQLEDLSTDLGDTLAIVAVHSPRHPSERDASKVNRILERAGISFPVVHDPDLETWARYQPGGWPSTVVIDHRGEIMGISQGVDDLDVLFEAVTLAERLASAARLEAAPSPDRLRPLPVPTPNRRSTDRGLSWPGGLCRLSDGRIAIADSGNDRVVVVELDDDNTVARARRIHGGLDRPSQVAELPDGSLAASEPNQGRIVRIARTKGNDDSPTTPEILTDGFLRPRGLATDRDGSLVVADAGAEQLFRILPDRQVGPIAGTGRTGTQDGRAGEAELAQPIAVARTDRGLAFLDLASSSLRILGDNGTVRTVTGGRFDRAGMLDGPAESAALDRPMDLAALSDGSIVVADTGNSRLRLLHERRFQTLGVAGLNEPEAVIEVGDGLLLVADTGNHRIVMVDLESHRVWEVELDEPDRRLTDRTTETAKTTLTGPAGGTVLIDHPTPGPGPWHVSVTAGPDELLACPLRVERTEPGQPVTVRLGSSGTGRVAVHVTGRDPATARVQVRHLRVIE